MNFHRDRLQRPIIPQLPLKPPNFLESLRDLAEILCVRVKGSPWSHLNERQIRSKMPKVSDGRHLHKLPFRESCPFTHRERSEKERKMDRKAPIITRNSIFGLHSVFPSCQIAHNGTSVPSIMESGHRVAPRGQSRVPHCQ